MMELFANGAWLPLAFAFLMGLAMLIYTVLDGYDLGVGILTKRATPEERNLMIASIGPFWDANETWLVLGVGILLVAFPVAHGVILGALYLPVALMLFGLIFRGVAFDFRNKAKTEKQEFWNKAFHWGSLITAFAQGYMLGLYILGFQSDIWAHIFAIIVGCSFIAGYSLVGACWLIMKCENELQKKAISWAKLSLWGTVIGVILVSITTPLVSPRIFVKWFYDNHLFYLAPVPLLTGLLLLVLIRTLHKLPLPQDKQAWVPFFTTIGIFILCFFGLAYSFYPYVVPEKITILEAASAYDSLLIIFIGTLFVLPFLLGYTFYAYRIFRGKARELTYH